MHFAVVKLTFEQGVDMQEDRKALRSLVEKIRTRFKVCSAICEDEGTAAIAITALGSSEERLTQTLDAITEFCESSGFGRVESEEALLDHIDSVSELAEEDDGDAEPE